MCRTLLDVTIIMFFCLTSVNKKTFLRQFLTEEQNFTECIIALWIRPKDWAKGSNYLPCAIKKKAEKLHGPGFEVSQTHIQTLNAASHSDTPNFTVAQKV